MITPDPVLMENEEGREFEFELGRLEDVAIDRSRLNKESAAQLEGGDQSHSQLAENAEAAEPEYESKWI
jgi:hypothetical protein